MSAIVCERPNLYHYAEPARLKSAKRRSVRVNLTARVGLLWREPLGRLRNVDAKAFSLNLHGAAIELGEDLTVGCEITVRNDRGMQCRARVVGIVRKTDTQYKYGLEFLPAGNPPQDFWGIVFPPARAAGERSFMTR